MKQALLDLKEFHSTFNCARQDSPAPISVETFMLRVDLIKEELEETFTAMRKYHQTGAMEDLIEVADGLADTCYVVIGTAVAYGIPLDKVWEEVHRSNMSKAPGGVVRYREDGKVLKPEGWTPPNLRPILEKVSNFGLAPILREGSTVCAFCKFPQAECVCREGFNVKQHLSNGDSK